MHSSYEQTLEPGEVGDSLVPLAEVLQVAMAVHLIVDFRGVAAVAQVHVSF